MYGKFASEFAQESDCMLSVSICLSPRAFQKVVWVLSEGALTFLLW